MRVHVIATGGTIASTAGEDGAAPSLSGADLVEAVPELAEYADVTVESVSQTPGFDMAPDAGPVARFTRNSVRWYRDLSPTPAVDTLETDATVPIVPSGTGMGADQLERAVAAAADGVVVAATGLGNVTAALGDAVAEAVEEVPVVVASRCLAGATEPVYGTPGGAVTLADHGARFADDLPPWKARVALLLALAADRTDEFEDLVARR